MTYYDVYTAARNMLATHSPRHSSELVLFGVERLCCSKTAEELHREELVIFL